ncbi:MAG TPA: twin-arginine translocase TatA/TatE family subunit [Microbacteriaceae bacterium]|nr:twin-arginine translocase TatA/TatE family subunit [Microbacteriaceae bacterium]
MSFGLTFDKLLLIAVLALLLIGPDRIPAYTRRLGEWARRARDYLGGARERMREEMGPEFDDIDWKQLDPRQYDPRRIIREALTEPPQASARESAYAQRQRRLREQREAAQRDSAAAPFDAEAT